MAAKVTAKRSFGFAAPSSFFPRLLPPAHRHYLFRVEALDHPLWGHSGGRRRRRNYSDGSWILVPSPPAATTPARRSLGFGTASATRRSTAEICPNGGDSPLAVAFLASTRYSSSSIPQMVSIFTFYSSRRKDNPMHKTVRDEVDPQIRRRGEGERERRTGTTPETHSKRKVRLVPGSSDKLLRCSN